MQNKSSLKDTLDERYASWFVKSANQLIFVIGRIDLINSNRVPVSFRIFYIFVLTQDLAHFDVPGGSSTLVWWQGVRRFVE